MSVNTFPYGTSAEIISIAQKFLPQLELSRAVLGLLPSRNINESMLIWEQRDNYQGLMGARGYNAVPDKVNPVGVSRFVMQPGVYGGFAEIDEEELTIRREEGTFNEPMDMSRLVLERTVQVTDAEVRLREYLSWQLFATGSYTSFDAKGTLIDSKAFTQRVYTATVTWSTTATATPLADWNAVSLLHRGYSVRFDRSATGYMNLKTANYQRMNTNASDLGGKRRDMGATFNSTADVNKLYLENDLPQTETFDEGYYDTSGVFHAYIPDSTVIVKGVREGNSPIGEWLFTRNANNPGSQPGIYMRVFDNLDRAVPRTIEVHRGFNGGPTVLYPSAIPVMQV